MEETASMCRNIFQNVLETTNTCFKDNYNPAVQLETVFNKCTSGLYLYVSGAI